MTVNAAKKKKKTCNIVLQTQLEWRDRHDIAIMRAEGKAVIISVEHSVGIVMIWAPSWPPCVVHQGHTSFNAF